MLALNWLFQLTASLAVVSDSLEDHKDEIPADLYNQMKSGQFGNKPRGPRGPPGPGMEDEWNEDDPDAMGRGPMGRKKGQYVTNFGGGPCFYKCQDGTSPLPKRKHVPQADGCGKSD